MRRSLLITGCFRDARNRSAISITVPRSPDLRSFRLELEQPIPENAYQEDSTTIVGEQEKVSVHGIIVCDKLRPTSSKLIVSRQEQRNQKL
ncbi:hypothetical protein DY000_02017696 [Brassica cretica]|uniref:Uncharacterized protein n=1 Tax=Brassica cretica TaxID=69181 RepID=A0ABQ7CV75_BRACR|nr:hypothetical protein DY000_02017696 [Brassica cretica]